MPIGARDDQANGHSVGLGQHAPFDAPFGPIRGIGAGFFPLPAAPCSLLRPYSASASRALSVHQTAPPRLSTASETLRPLPILGTDHEPWNGELTPWHLTPPTDSRCAGRRKSRRRTAGPGCEVCLRQSDACFYARAAPAPEPPTIPPIPEIPSSLCSREPGAASFSSVPWKIE